MVEAADAYVRILIRVPEAYLLLYPLSTSRPGLLVLDADARRVHHIALPKDAATIAEQLRDVVDPELYEALEMFRMTIKGNDAAFREAVEELDAVEETAFQRGQFRVSVSKGQLHPTKLEELALRHKVAIQWRNPIPVALAAPAGTSRDVLKGLPGAWYTNATSGYVADVLLDPGTFKAAVSDLDARVFKLPGVSKGGGGAVVARAPLSVAGVLSVFPDIFGGSQLVVGRKGSVRWSDVKSAFKQAGVNAKMKR